MEGTRVSEDQGADHQDTRRPENESRSVLWYADLPVCCYVSYGQNIVHHEIRSCMIFHASVVSFR
jgi:hypothetical protein